MRAKIQIPHQTASSFFLHFYLFKLGCLISKLCHNKLSSWTFHIYNLFTGKFLMFISYVDITLYASEPTIIISAISIHFNAISH